MQRGNKGRLVAMGNKNLSSASVLRFLLCALQPPPANSLRVCAAASAALWAILFHCERAKPALKALVGGVGGVGGGGGGGGGGAPKNRRLQASTGATRERQPAGAPPLRLRWHAPFVILPLVLH